MSLSKWKLSILMVLEDHLLLQVLVLDPLDGSCVAEALDQGRKQEVINESLKMEIINFNGSGRSSSLTSPRT